MNNELSTIQEMKLNIIRKNPTLGMKISKKDLTNINFLKRLVDILPETLPSFLNNPNVYNDFDFMREQIIKKRIVLSDISQNSTLWNNNEFVFLLVKTKIIDLEDLLKNQNIQIDANIIRKLLNDNLISNTSNIWNDVDIVKTLLLDNSISVSQVPKEAGVWNNISFVEQLLEKDQYFRLFIPETSTIWNNANLLSELLQKDKIRFDYIPKNSPILNDTNFVMNLLQKDIIKFYDIPKNSPILNDTNFIMNLLQKDIIEFYDIPKNSPILNDTNFVMNLLQKDIINLNVIPSTSSIWNDKKFIKGLVINNLVNENTFNFNLYSNEYFIELALASGILNVKYILSLDELELWKSEKMVIYLLMYGNSYGNKKIWIDDFPRTSPFFNNNKWLIQKIKERKINFVPSQKLLQNYELCELLLNEKMVTLDELLKISSNDFHFILGLLEKQIINKNDIPKSILNNESNVSLLLERGYITIDNIPRDSKVWDSMNFVLYKLGVDKINLLPSTSALWNNPIFMMNLINNKKNQEINLSIIPQELWNSESFVSMFLKIPELYAVADRKVFNSSSIPSNSALWKNCEFIFKNLDKIDMLSPNLEQLFTSFNFMDEWLKKYKNSNMGQKFVSRVSFITSQMWKNIEFVKDCLESHMIGISSVPNDYILWNDTKWLLEHINKINFNAVLENGNCLFWNNKMVISSLLDSKKIKIDNIPEESSLLLEREFIIEQIKKHNIDKWNFPKTGLLSDTNFMMEIFESGILSLNNIPKTLWNDEKFVFTLLEKGSIKDTDIPRDSSIWRNEGKILEQIKKGKIKTDNISVLSNVWSSPEVLSELLNLNILNIKELPWSCILWDNTTFVKKQLDEKTITVKDIPLTSEVWNYKSFVQMLVTSGKIRLYDVPNSRLREPISLNDKDYYDKAVNNIKQNPSDVFSLSKKDLNNQKLMMKIAKVYPDIFDLASIEIQENMEFVNTCIKSKLETIEQIKSEENNEKLVIENLKLEQLKEKLKGLIIKNKKEDEVLSQTYSNYNSPYSNTFEDIKRNPELSWLMEDNDLSSMDELGEYENGGHSRGK